MSRYLLAADKATAIAHLRTATELDDGIRPYLDRLNAIPGLCTLQSCTGHLIAKHDDGSTTKRSGQFWIHLDQQMHKVFRENVFAFAAHPNMEEVSTMYQPWSGGQEIVEILFQGHGDGKFEESVEFIIGFFERLAWLVHFYTTSTNVDC